MDKRVAPTIILILVIFFILLQAGSLIFVLNKDGLGILWTLILTLDFSLPCLRNRIRSQVFECYKCVQHTSSGSITMTDTNYISECRIRLNIYGDFGCN